MAPPAKTIALTRYAVQAPQEAMVWRVGFLTASLLVVAAGMATALVGAQRHVEVAFELDVGVPALCAAAATGDSCRAAMTSWLGKPFGVPAAALGLATHLVAFALLFIVAAGATTAQWPLVRAALAGLRVVVGVLLFALFLFGFIGRVLLGHNCEICLMMHTVNFCAMLVLGMTVAAFGRRLKTEILGSGGGWLAAAAAATVFAIPATARQLDKMLAGRAPKVGDLGNRRAEQAARLDLLRPCLGQCITGLVYTPDQAAKGPALDFGPVGKGAAYRVLSVDLTCPHCRRELRSHSLPALGAAVAGKGPPVQVVLRPRAQHCNAASPNKVLGARMCQANAALLCAYKASPAAAVAYLDAELRLPNEDTYLDREGWLRKHASGVAADCLAAEKANGFSALKAIAATGEAWQTAAAKVHRECTKGIDDGPRPSDIAWCFTGLPGMAVVRPPTAVPMRGATADPDFIRNASREAEFRWSLLDPCL
ncbi:MAG: vitamin K epoxide reductase family protein [Deltaproteobacteria bacterium]|nr:vitamin K epoxide reductase family protein [Deltaproteobacteria bacterium]